MLTTTTRTLPAPKRIEPPPLLAGTTQAKPAPEADAQPAHWGDGIALCVWALGLLLLFTLLVLEAVGNLFRW